MENIIMCNQDNSNYSELTESEKLNQDKVSSVQLKDEEKSHPKPSSQKPQIKKESRKEEIKRRLTLYTLIEIRLKLFIAPTLLVFISTIIHF